MMAHKPLGTAANMLNTECQITFAPPCTKAVITLRQYMTATLQFTLILCKEKHDPETSGTPTMASNECCQKLHIRRTTFLVPTASAMFTFLNPYPANVKNIVSS
jgi:hypothetical protein